MNPWIIVGIIVWLGCGFLGRCMMKALWVKGNLRQDWSHHKLLADIFILFGLVFLLNAIYTVKMASKITKEKNLWGLML